MPNPHALITDDLLNALAEVESHRNPNAIGDQDLRYPAFGMFQMRQPAFQDVQHFQPQAATGITDLSTIIGHPDVQRQLAQAYLQVLQDHYGMQTLPELIESYNAGHTAVKKKKIPASTKQYLLRVQQQLTP